MAAPAHRTSSSDLGRLTYPDLARIVGTGLISTGVGLLLFVLVTILWGDPFTRLGERGAQERLEQQFAELQAADGGGQLAATSSLDPELTRLLAKRAKKTVPLGRGFGRIRIPSIGIDKVLVHGARVPDLKKGPGLYRETGMPGVGEPIAIAGHRTTYGAPFLDIDRLKPGRRIVLTTSYGQFTYTVTRQEIIAPDDWSIIEFGAAERSDALQKRVLSTRQCITTCEHLVLTACHPKYSAAQRLAVYAKLTGVSLRRVAPAERAA